MSLEPIFFTATITKWLLSSLIVQFSFYHFESDLDIERFSVFRKDAGGQTVPIISGVHMDIITGKISPVTFNRTFTDFEGGIRDALMVNVSSLFKNKSSLRKMIAKQEDRGFAKSKSIKGYDQDVRRY